MLKVLPPPARYFPIEKGKYEVAAGLRILGTPFGNGRADTLMFQLDANFPAFRASKLEGRQERLEKFFCTANYPAKVERAVNEFLARRLEMEHPDYFALDTTIPALTCHLTGETLRFDKDWNYLPRPGCSGALDAFACQFQEDIAVTCLDNEKDWLAALHLCSPGHWSAEQKIGGNFISIHQPVPGIERVSIAAKAFIEASIHKGPYTRFAWSFASDNRLNHHPEPPPGWTKERWKGRTFVEGERLEPFLRIERQVVFGLPEVNAFLFTIHIYFISGEEIRNNATEKGLLRNALSTMTESQLQYKGVKDNVAVALRWLDQTG